MEPREGCQAYLSGTAITLARPVLISNFPPAKPAITATINIGSESWRCYRLLARLDVSPVLGLGSRMVQLGLVQSCKISQDEASRGGLASAGVTEVLDRVSGSDSESCHVAPLSSVEWFGLHLSPEPFDNCIGMVTANGFHAQSKSLGTQIRGEYPRRELRSAVGVHDGLRFEGARVGGHVDDRVH